MDIAAGKLKIVDAWKNFEGGALLSDPQIRSLSTDFAKQKLKNENLPTFSSTQLESFLKANNDWFESIFKNNLPEE